MSDMILLTIIQVELKMTFNALKLMVLNPEDPQVIIEVYNLE